MRKVPFALGEYYHLYNRGVDKRIVFTTQEEYERFLSYMYMLNAHDTVRPSDFFRTHTLTQAYEIERGEPLVAIGAFCLMPNHFHLYVTPLVEGGVSKFMQKLQTAYTKYFNEKHRRTGALFGSTFKSEHIDSDRYAKYLFSYIHLNPAKLKDPKWKEKGPRDWKILQKFATAYPYSSYQAYATDTHSITNPYVFPSYLKSKRDVVGHLQDWLKYNTARS